MKKKLVIFLSFLLVAICSVFGLNVSLANAATPTKEGCVEIKTGFTGGDSTMYYSTPVKGAVTVEFDVKFNQFQGAHFGFGLMSDKTESNPYSSGLFFANSQAFYTPWAASFVGAVTTWKNYNENYWGVYMYYRVRIKMEVNASGDVTLYAKSIEPTESYAGSNAQQAEYVQVSDTIKGLYATQVAEADGAYISMFFRGGTDASMYYYGFTATDTVGTYGDHCDGAAISDAYTLADGIAGALTDGTLVYSQSTYEKIESAITISALNYVAHDGDGYGLAYVWFNHNTTAAQWTTFTDQLANIEYKRADGTVETLNNVVCISADKIQIRLAGNGEAWTLTNGDVITFKAGFTLATDSANEVLAQDVKFYYVESEGGFLSQSQYDALLADKEGAIVFATGYPNDGMINNKTKLTGAMDISIDIDMTGLSNFGFGLMNTPNDSSPYSSKLLFASKTNVYTPWATAFVGSPTAYKDGYTIVGRTTLTIRIASNGDATLYADGVQIFDTITGLYGAEVANGGYFCMFARVSGGKSYIYEISVTDANGNTLNKLDFAYNLLNIDNFNFSNTTTAALGMGLYWQEPTGEFIPVPTAELILGGIATSVTVGQSVDLTPEIANQAEGDALTVEVDGTTIDSLTYAFETAGSHTVVYTVKNANGEVLDSATIYIFVKVLSTQNSAETNFNQGYFDGNEFEATAGVAVSEGRLLIKSSEPALFLTKGYSENFILTFEITSYTKGEIKVVFGKIGDAEYAFTFLSNGNVKFGDNEYTLDKNIYGLLSDGDTVTVRVKVFGAKASLYLRSSSESVENIDVELLSLTDVIVVGQAGFGGINAEFTADNVKFVSLTSVNEDNTYQPSEEELDPGTGTSGGMDSGDGSSATSASDGTLLIGCNCNGSVALGGAVAGITLLAGVALIAKKREEK